MMIKMPPMIEDSDKGSPVRIQSAIATRKIVSNAATDDKTGEVNDMRTRKEPEKAIEFRISRGKRGKETINLHDLLALAKTEIQR